ncbi:hypothetical protein [Burkholderia pseudomultivorans]|nr:hypothetical protein [Burkholderia pseudomultivorans]
MPVVSCWLVIPWFDAFFFCYALVFQWTFDRVFDVPAAPRPR